MPPENQPQPQVTTFEEHAVPINPVPPISNTEAEIPDFEATAARKPSLKGMILGVIFLSVSILGGLGLILAYLPVITARVPETQAAAVAAVDDVDLFKSLELQARAAYVYDAKEDKELFAKNPTAQLPLASITKIALVLVVAEVLPLDSTITISRTAVERGGGGLTWGEEWKVRDLIDYTLITSSNTGAEALAETASPLLAAKYPKGSKSNATVWRMNSLAQEIGMEETYFINATGLDESTTQAGAQSSASDIAELFAYALRTNRDIFAGTARTNMPLGPINFPEREAHNTNNALFDIEGLIMGKTGTTDLAGGNLAIVFEAGSGHPIIVVVLGSTVEGRFLDIKKLADAARKAVGLSR